MHANKSAVLAPSPRRFPLRLRLSEVATLVGGQRVGDADPWITGVAGIPDAADGDLTFLAQRRYRMALKDCPAAAVLVDQDESVDRPAVRVESPALAFTIMLERFAAAARKTWPRGIHPTASVGEGVELGEDVALGAHVVLQDGVRIGPRTTLLPGTVVLRHARIGADCLLYPNVTIYEGTEIGDRVILHGGVVIGSDGFGYVRDDDTLHKVPHLGNVVIEDDVEIGANSCVDRATTGVTRIQRGTKLDNLVQIAHNVRIGASSLLCAQVGVGGSTELGNGVKVAGQVGIVGHIRIGDGAVLGAQSGVTKSVPAHTAVSGYPALPHTRELRQQAALARLPDLLETVRELEQRLLLLEEQLRDARAS